MDRVCYVTCFLDINRGNWHHFRRTTEEYFTRFQPLLDLFITHPDSPKYDLVIFIDKHHVSKLNVGSFPSNIIVQEIDEEYLSENSVLWRRVGREKEIMESEGYKSIVRHRLCHPEHHDPKYTLINHCKVDCLNLAMSFTDATHFCWVDFGYFQHSQTIPKNFIDIEKLDKDKINYTLINPIDHTQDDDVIYQLQSAPDKVGGFFFFGSREVLSVYQNLYHSVHEQMQAQNIVDDDQHLTLRCYFANPSLFSFHHLGEFHRALTHFQKES
jgi:hypothetical protein